MRRQEVRRYERRERKEHAQNMFGVFFVAFGFIWGKFDSWMGYAPVRSQLRRQKKQNKKLSKEQQKLTKEVEGLHENISTLKEEKKAAAPKEPLKQRIAAWFRRKEEN